MKKISALAFERMISTRPMQSEDCLRDMLYNNYLGQYGNELIADNLTKYYLDKLYEKLVGKNDD